MNNRQYARLLLASGVVFGGLGVLLGRWDGLIWLVVAAVALYRLRQGAGPPDQPPK